MAEVNLSIHGKTYGISCDEGQEERVAELGKYVDERLRDIAGAGAATNESHLLVLAALVLADEVFDLRDGQAEAQPQTVIQGLSEEDERMIVNAIGHLKQRIESVTERLQTA